MAALTPVVEGPTLRWVSPLDIFNLPLYESYLVIDTRSADAFSRASIATAVSYPAPGDPEVTEEERKRRLYVFAKGYASEFYRPENANPVVIYGDAGTVHAHWLATKLSYLQVQRKSLTVYQRQGVEEKESFDPLEHFCHTVADRVKEIWLLEGGYQAFQEEYPFLCGNIATEDMFPVPHQIDTGLFMGSRVVPLTQDCLLKMRITHMIVSCHQELELKQLEGIELLSCDIHDSNTEEMSPCWTASCQFIKEARQKGGRVLVILHGRSRSASIILAYLINEFKMDFPAAWETLTKRCWHLIDRSLVYEEQLRVWQMAELQAITQ